jgi:serine/threonine protein kinase
MPVLLERSINKIRSPRLREWTHALAGTELRKDLQSTIRNCGATLAASQMVPIRTNETRPRIEDATPLLFIRGKAAASGAAPDRAPAQNGTVNPPPSEQPKVTKKWLMYGGPIALVTLLKTFFLPLSYSVPMFSSLLASASIAGKAALVLGILANNAIPGLAVGLIIGAVIHRIIWNRIKPAVVPTAQNEPAAPRTADFKGRLTNYYKTGKVLGEGGMGKVEQATTTTGELVAVKTMSLAKMITLMEEKDPAAKKERAVELVLRFYNEYTTGKKLDHDNIAGTIDTNITTVFPDIKDSDQFRRITLAQLEKAPELFIVNEFIPDRDESAEVPPNLRDYVGHGMRPKQLVDLFLPAMEALEYAHINGVYHRDFKPQNLLVTIVRDKATIKIIDYGIAKDEAKETALTQAGEFPGSFFYLAPKKIREASKADVAANRFIDLFQFGLIMYECLTGNNPRRIDPGKPDQWFEAPAISEQDIPNQELRAALSKLMVDHDGTDGPPDHFKSATEMKEEFQRIHALLVKAEAESRFSRPNLSKPGALNDGLGLPAFSSAQQPGPLPHVVPPPPPPRRAQGPLPPPPPKLGTPPVREFLGGNDRAKIVADLREIENLDMTPAEARTYAQRLLQISADHANDQEVMGLWDDANYLVTKAIRGSK